MARSFRWSHVAHLRARHLSSAAAPPLLWSSPADESAGAAVHLLSWGRGSSGQLGGGVEEIRYYPSPVAHLRLPADFLLPPPAGRLPDAATSAGTVAAGISCGLFHSSLLVDGQLWMWGKGDGGRLGFGHESPAFVPTLNPNIDGVRQVALGGVHSVALTNAGEVFTWFVQDWIFFFFSVTCLMNCQ